MSNRPQFPRIIISAPKSGSGKTVLTIALMKALSLRGLPVSAGKCGPDYIDPLFHQKILGVPSKSLDLFFTPPEKTQELFLRDAAGRFSVIEGVMGLYDGLGGTTSDASTYDLAVALQAPVVLVIDAKGASYSLVAEINGFLSLDRAHLIRGVILNNISAMFYQNIKPVIETNTGVSVLGFFPKLPELQLESRYLGLQLPDEIADIQDKALTAARELEKSVDVDAVIALAEGAADLDAIPEEKDAGNLQPAAVPVRIAVARDEAFCFYYEDNLRLLKQLGAQLVYFSPVHDASLPADIDGILLGGGYPELWARQLTENCTMRNSVRAAVLSEMPSLAECGGFMYLHDSITTEDGSSYAMAGAIPGSCSYTGKLVRFGYVTVTAPGPDGGHCIRGHEFHYFDSTNTGSDGTAVKPVTGRSWQCCHVTENHWWGFPHLYYESNPAFARWFIDRCRTFRETRNHAR